MCLLISQPAGVTFSKAEVADFLKHNPDGFGIAYGDGDTLHTARLVGTFADVWALYQQMGAGRRCVLHFRMKTHGDSDEANAHPFRVTDDIALAHNGILSIGNPVTPAMSDTWHFVQYFVAPIAQSNPELLFDPAWLEMMGRLIGTGNKLALVHRDGRIGLVNERAGTTHRGAWMSNTYAWSAPATTPPARGKRVTGYAATDWERVEEPADWTYTPAVPDAWEAMAGHYQRDGVVGLYDWTREDPTAAVDLLASATGSSEAEAREWLEDRPADAVGFLEDFLYETDALDWADIADAEEVEA